MGQKTILEQNLASADFLVQVKGTTGFFTPLTPSGRQWIESNRVALIHLFGQGVTIDYQVLNLSEGRKAE